MARRRRAGTTHIGTLAVVVGAILATGCTRDPTAPAPAHDREDVCCTPPADAPALDHVVVAVSALAPAVNAWQRAGFVVKPGRLHANGLLNAHVKFPGGSEIELMSVTRPSSDDVSGSYERFLEGGEGGAFLALDADPNEVRARAGLAGVRARLLNEVYVVLDDVRHLFVMRAIRVRNEDPVVFDHANRARGLSEVWLTGDERVEAALLAFGAVRCGGDDRTGAASAVFALNGGRVVVQPAAAERRHEVTGVVLRTDGVEEPAARSAEDMHGIWLRFSADESVPGR